MAKVRKRGQITPPIWLIKVKIAYEALCSLSEAHVRHEDTGKGAVADMSEPERMVEGGGAGIGFVDQ